MVVDSAERDDDLVCDVTGLLTSLCARLCGRPLASVDTYGEVKIEDLNIAAMKQSMRRRAFRRSLADAGLGAFGPPLTYKAKRAKVKVVVVDRYFPSSQIHHNCTGKLTGAKLATRLTCDTCHVEVDRDEKLRSISVTGRISVVVSLSPLPCSFPGHLLVQATVQMMG